MEARYVDPETGGEKEQKLARFDLIPWDSMTRVAQRYGTGAEKYSDRNWERGYPWSLSIAALYRHMAAFCEREDNEDHLAAVVFHALALMRFEEEYPEADDRG
jgi:hypothetical protein